MDEKIDHLNEFGKIIGIVNKSIAHRDGLWHKSIHVWVINEQNQILLQKRCSEKKFYPDIWDASFAGHIEAGESTKEGAIREGEEELGVKIDINKLEHLFTYKEELKYNNIYSNEFVDVYLFKQEIKLNDIIVQEEEVSEVRYITISEFLNMVRTKNEQLFPHPEEYKQLEIYFKQKELI